MKYGSDAKIMVILSLILACLLTISPRVLANEKIRIKFATVAPEGTIWMKAMRDLDKNLKQKTDGRLGFLIYAGGIQGDEISVLRKILNGQIHGGAFSGEGISRILPAVRVLDLPFLFKSSEEVDLVHNKLRDHFAGAFREKGFAFMAWAELGNVHILSKHPVRMVSDFKKLKVWTGTGDPIAKDTFSAMGTNPIPLSVTDVTTALNTGMVDTVYAPPMGALALQWNAYTSYMTTMPFTHATGVILISEKTYKRIPRDLAQLLKKEFASAMAALTLELRDKTEDAVKLIQESGVELIPIPKGPEREAFNRIHHQVAQGLAGDIYPKELLERVYQILNRNPGTD